MMNRAYTKFFKLKEKISTPVSINERSFYLNIIGLVEQNFWSLKNKKSSRN